jgi:hypothetical protein
MTVVSPPHPRLVVVGEPKKIFLMFPREELAAGGLRNCQSSASSHLIRSSL